MKILSLFDGISCARVALERAGFKIEKYYASEVDKYAIQIAQKNYPDTIQLGSVKDIDCTGGKLHYGMGRLAETNIDLLVGGSPCQDLSIAKKNRKGLDGDRSGLFWEYVRILKEVKPKYFILENVASMSKEARATITETLWDIQPVMINAALVSAQNRKRLFWIGELADKRHIGHWDSADYVKVEISQPEDRGILLKDILQPPAEVDERMVMNGKAFSLTASYNGAVAWNSIEKKQRTMVNAGRIIGRKLDENGTRKDYSDIDSKQVVEVNENPQKTNTLSTVQKDNILIVREATKKGYAIAQDGDSIDLSFPNSKTRRGRVGNKVKNLMTSQNIGVFTNSIIRKLTPIECERLQSMPDNYTEGISNSQRYKCLGNAFNCAVVKHILSFIPR